MFTALLDTCVLWPSLQRDFLLSLAIEGTYRPIWSAVILEELVHAEARKLTARGEDETKAQIRAEHLVQRMSEAFDDAEISGWKGLEGTYDLPDPDDERVVAAAVVGGAGAIVTHNVKDFPRCQLPDGLEVLLPNDFAANTVALHPGRAQAAVAAIACRSGVVGPRLTVDDVLDQLAERYSMQPS